jgi:hypothetical protein
MEQKKKEQDVLIVRDEQTGEIGVVAGLKRDGTPNMKAAKGEHAQDFLRFDRHGDVLDNFFANFYRQCKEPKRFGFYRVAAEGADKVIEVLKELLKNPEQNKELLAPHKVDTTKYEQQATQQQQTPQEGEAQGVEETPEADGQQQETPTASQTEETTQQAEQPPAEEQANDKGYKPIDDSRLDRAEVAERWGIDLAALEQSGDLERMRHYGKSQLVECNPDFGGVRVPMQARLSLRENPDGTVSIIPHPIRREPNLDEYRNVKFTPEDQENLKKTGNLGRVAEVVDPATGELIPSFISIDRITNETVSVPVAAIRIPDKVKGVLLTQEQQKALAEGKGVYVEGMTSQSGKKFNATLQINADKRGLDFHFGGQRKAQQQEQTQAPDGAPRERRLRIGKTLLGVEVKPEYKAGWEQNKWVYIEGMTDKKGKLFNAYVRPNHEKVKYDFSRKRPEQSQIYEVKPDNASRTQVAVNSEGKTDEATKHVGEPLQRGQTAPANEEQQRRQQNANKPRMKM